MAGQNAIHLARDTTAGLELRKCLDRDLHFLAVEYADPILGNTLEDKINWTRQAWRMIKDGG